MRKELTDNQKAWVAALRSGEYTQCTGSLTKINDGKMSNCCLGVVCELAAKAGLNVKVKDEERGKGFYKRRYDDNVAFMPTSVKNWVGMKRADGGLESSIKLPTSLAHANDWRQMTFAQIADLIEQHAEELFV